MTRLAMCLWGEGRRARGVYHIHLGHQLVQHGTCSFSVIHADFGVQLILYK